MKLFSTVRNFFYVRYVKFVEFVTLFMLARTGKLVRNLILLKGKNPDYVAPPPPPPAPPKEETKRAQYSFRFSNSSNEWVKNPSKHPVVRSRLELIERAAKAKAEREARLAAGVSPESAEEAPSLENVLSDALDQLNKEAEVVETAASVEETGEKQAGQVQST